MMKDKKRFWLKRPFRQLLSALLINSWIPGFLKASPYSGPTKSVCLPVLNCYSCPGAYTSCPIGTLQQSLYSFPTRISLFVAGMLGAAGVAAGRWFCGNMCPFGLYQDLLKKLSGVRLAMPRILRKLKYLVLLLGVFLIPVILKKPVFCSYLCPAGTLEGGLTLAWTLDVPLGFIYYFKISLLVLFSGLSVVVRRPFCSAVCPLGAILGSFNSISLLSMEVDSEKCVKCDKCLSVCPSDIRIYENPASGECLRCGDCVDVCPVDCISMGFVKKKSEVSLEKY